MQDLATVASKALSKSFEQRELRPNSVKPEYLRAAETLLGSARTGEANDPETYITMVLRILTQYSPEVATWVAETLPRKLDYLPRQSEIEKACIEADHVGAFLRRWEENSRKQIAERAKLEAIEPPNQTYEEFRAEMAARGMAMP